MYLVLSALLRANEENKKFRLFLVKFQLAEKPLGKGCRCI